MTVLAARQMDHPPGNPYPLYQRLGASGPVQWLDGARSWLVTGYAAGRQVLTDDTFLTNDVQPDVAGRVARATQRDLSSLRHMLETMPVFLNPPLHAPVRRLLARMLTYRAGAVSRQEISSIVAHRIDELRRRGGFDLMQDFGARIATTVIARILGVPEEDWAELAYHSRTIIEALDLFLPSLRDYQKINDAARAMIDYFSDQAARRRRAPREDGISFMLSLAAEYEVAEADIVGFCVFLFMAGAETTANFICGGAMEIIQTPNLAAVLRAEPGVMTTVSDELLRHFSPIQAVSRIAAVDRIVAGKTISAGQAVSVVLGAANRDSEVYPDGGCPMLGRKTSRHLAFGAGAHLCLGGPLARLEGEVAFSALLELPNLRVDADHVVWSRRRTARGFTTVPVFL